MNEFRKKEHKSEIQLEKELNYWRDCRIDYCKSLFGGLIHIATSPSLLRSLIAKHKEDINLELLCFGQLRTQYRVELLDAVHLMQAQGSKINWFITEDQDLIKKSNKIPWLVFKNSTLKDFLKSHI